MDRYGACARGGRGRPITSNCGFALRYQAAIAAAATVPVSVSSLNLLPYLLRSVPAGGKVAVLTYDSRHFDAGLFALAGVADDARRIVIAGIEGSRCHELMLRPDNPATVQDIQDAVLEVAQLRDARGEGRRVSVRVRGVRPGVASWCASAPDCRSGMPSTTPACS